MRLIEVVRDRKCKTRTMSKTQSLACAANVNPAALPVLFLSPLLRDINFDITNNLMMPRAV
jgi:hypothetical protein